jgi:D-alanyl-lipoteichoic acid acyltransferase DltB (MBOAT superfamily)
MLFNSLVFLIFLPIVFICFWGLNKNKIKYQNVVLLIASYTFYGWWDWRFLFLILFSTLVDFFIGVALNNTANKSSRKLLLSVSLIVNIGLLLFFKYYNFFIDSWVESWSSLGVTMHRSTLNIILPVGISFYTFQTLSYTIDVYRNKLESSKNFVAFATFVAFFPQLVAGPIERATNLLPQFYTKRKFDSRKAIDGLHLILWGLFKKMVIADGCATYVNAIFNTYETASSATLFLGVVYFSFQIYGDFSGYSDIAIGVSKLFGFDLMTNFKTPYFSRDIAEFWRRWHISLSTWFRDYLYIPLGGSKGTKLLQFRNVTIIFLVSGFWHGANWTFVVWGALHALFFMPLLLFNKNRKHIVTISKTKLLPSLKEGVNMGVTFLLVSFTWIFFRADSIQIAFRYCTRMLTDMSFDIPYLSMERYSVEMLPLIFILIIIEWLHREKEHPFTGRFFQIKIVVIIILLMIFGVYSNHQDFIYFQF